MNLEWWQWVGGAITLLGLSPAPWIAAMLAGRLRPLSWHTERVTALDKAHSLQITELDKAHSLQIAELNTAHTNRVDDYKAEIARLESRHSGTVERILGERDYERTAKDVERGRSNALAEKMVEIATEFGATTVHLLNSLPKVEQ